MPRSGRQREIVSQALWHQLKFFLAKSKLPSYLKNLNGLEGFLTPFLGWFVDPSIQEKLTQDNDDDQKWYPPPRCGILRAIVMCICVVIQNDDDEARVGTDWGLRDEGPFTRLGRVHTYIALPHTSPSMMMMSLGDVMPENELPFTGKCHNIPSHFPLGWSRAPPRIECLLLPPPVQAAWHHDDDVSRLNFELHSQ